MLNELTIKRFEALFETNLYERRKNFPIDLTQIDSRASMHGVYHSGSRLLQVQQAHERELEIRSIIAWESLVRVHRTLGCPLNDALADDLKAKMGQMIKNSYDELTKSLLDRIQKVRQNMKLNLDESYSQAIRKHEIEIDLYVDSL